jgi:hypothetical protein
VSESVLRLDDRGIATAYVALTPGSLAAEIDRCKAAFSRIRNTVRHSVSEPEIFYLLGQADIGVKAETIDFREILDVQYPTADSQATSVNWVFSIPYVNGVVSPQSSFRFILHIRLCRYVYAYRHVEDKIIGRLAELLKRHVQSAQIQAGLGWADLIVDGWCGADAFESIAAFSDDVRGLKIGAGDEMLPALQSLVSIVGFSGEPPAFPSDVGLVTFFRAAPGRYAEAAAQLREHGNALQIIDGKADFIVSSRNAESVWRSNTRMPRGRSLERVETHVMLSPSGLERNVLDAQLTLNAGSEVLHRRECGCEEAQRGFIPVVTHHEDRLLPADLRHATENVLFLLRASIGDRSICCDLRDAIGACYSGLAMILTAMDEKAREIPGDSIAAKHVEMLALQHRLDEWIRCTERLLRQRTGPAEFLGQGDRSFPYNGGVQKFLYLADKLINDFARRIRPVSPPSFAVMCDTVSTVVSLPNGIVRVPTTKIFAFPLIVPDLWHEVGVRLFLQEFAQQVGKYAPARERGEFLSNVAEHYADLVVYFHGFRANFTKFMTSIVHRWREAYRDFAYATHAHSVGQLLARLYLVYELHQMRAAIAERDVRRLEWFYNADATVVALSRELRELMTVFLTDARADVILTDADWRLLELNAVTADFSRVQRNLYLPLLREAVQTPVPDLSRFERGQIVQFDETDDLNDYFGELASRIQSSDERMSPFLVMATLARSAEIEYHRRQSRVKSGEQRC